MRTILNNITSKRSFQFSSIALLVVILGIAGCGAIKMNSHWTKTPIDVTSITSDLQSELTPIDDKPAMVGIMNDSNYLYIALVTNDKSIQRQIMARGFTIWFDRAGGDAKQFGVRFPLGMQPGDFQRMRDLWSKESEDGTEGRKEEGRPSFMPPIDTIEADILGPKLGAHERVKISQLKQIAVKIFMSDDRVQYNIRVPLTDNGPQPYAIGTTIGSTIGIGFETAAFEPRSQMKMNDEQADGEGGMGAGGGRGGRGGRGGGGRGGMGGGEGPPGGMKRTEPLNFWTVVHLADGKTE